MSAKFVNLIEFFECKIFTQVKTIGSLGSADGDMVVARIDLIDVRPDKELAVRKCRHRNARMVDGHVLFRIDLFLAIEQVAVHNSQRHVHTAHQPVRIGKQGNANARKEQDLREAEEQVDPRHIRQQVPARQHQYKNVQRHQEQATQVERAGLGFIEMGNGMCQDKTARY